MRLEMLIRMQNEILTRQRWVCFSNEPFEKRPVMSHSKFWFPSRWAFRVSFFREQALQLNRISKYVVVNMHTHSKMVFSGLRAAWFLAASPTRRSSPVCVCVCGCVCVCVCVCADVCVSCACMCVHTYVQHTQTSQDWKYSKCVRVCVDTRAYLCMCVQVYASPKENNNKNSAWDVSFIIFAGFVSMCLFHLLCVYAVCMSIVCAFMNTKWVCSHAVIEVDAWKFCLHV